MTLEFADGQAQREGPRATATAVPTRRATTVRSSFESFAVTEMACDEPLMALESAYLTALGHVTGFGVEGTWSSPAAMSR